MFKQTKKIKQLTLLTMIGFAVNSYAQTYNISQGWNLVGATQDINSSQFNQNVSTLWIYKDGIWKATSPDGSLNEALNIAGYNNATLVLDTGIGFWVNAKTAGSVVIESQDNNIISYKIVDTAQTKCYDSTSGTEKTCSNTGYDSDYSGNQPSYIVSNSGNIVTDNVTSLMWTQSSDIDGDGITTDIDDKKSYDDAVSYCSALSLDGYDDWRLPDIKTLYSLIQFSGEDPSGYNGTDTSSLITFLDSNFDRAFGDESNSERIIDGQYATTTKYVSTTMNGDETIFGVNFIDGRIKGYPLEMQGSDKRFYVLCTRGEENYGKNNFANNDNGTITDNATALMWEQNDTKSTDFENAIEICETSTTAGYDNWRLPNAKELQSIVEYSASPDTTSSAAIDDIFNSTSITNEEGIIDWGYYWSSTTHANMVNGMSASYLSFGRALGNMNGSILDVHGAGAQRSNNKQSESNDPIANTGVSDDGSTYYYKGPQGDILRIDNMVRCVRDINVSSSDTSALTS